MKKTTLSLLLAAFAASAHAQAPATAPASTGTPATAAPAKKPVSVGDKKFVKDVSDAILIEQKLLDVATKNTAMAANESAKRTTGAMTGDLKRIWTALATLATAKGAEVAQEVSKSDLARVERLGKEKPDKFEKEFYKDLGKETKQTAKLFEGSKFLQDPEIKKFAEDWNVTIKGHNVSVEDAEKKLAAPKKK